MAWLIKSDQLTKELSILISDVRSGIEAIADKGHISPSVDIYRLVSTLTFRIVGAYEFAEDTVLRAQFDYYCDLIEKSATPLSVMSPFFPWPGTIQRNHAGFRIYRLLDNIVKERQKKGKAPDEAVQQLLERGDGMTELVFFILGALFAGQLNSGINAAMVLCYLATSPEWLSKVRAEVKCAAAKHGKVGKASVLDRLDDMGLEAWKNEFPVVQLYLRETIRLSLPGTAFRKYTGSELLATGHGAEVVPPGSFPICPLADVHMDPDTYTVPGEWDPSRYLPERAEDKKRPHAYLGWGSGRHPCQGMRFAKLEQNIITAYFVAPFDFELEDEHRVTLAKVGHCDIQAFVNHGPKRPYFLRTKPRKDQTSCTASLLDSQVSL